MLAAWPMPGAVQGALQGVVQIVFPSGCCPGWCVQGAATCAAVQSGVQGFVQRCCVGGLCGLLFSCLRRAGRCQNANFPLITKQSKYTTVQVLFGSMCQAFGLTTKNRNSTENYCWDLLAVVSILRSIFRPEGFLKTFL